MLVTTKNEVTASRERLLSALNIGKSVAEFDAGLPRYFLQTEIFHRFIADQVDIVAGDKGSGKSAIYKYISGDASALPELKDISILPGFNPSGAPVFKRLAESQPLTEGQYISVWKAYILSLLGSWALPYYEGEADPPHEAQELATILEALDLRAKSDAPHSVFGRITSWLKRILNPKRVEVACTFNELGLPVITPAATFESSPGGSNDDNQRGRLVSHEEALGLLDDIVGGLGVTSWVFLDRLDEAFVGFPEIEAPALRALFRTYLDLLAFENIRIKIFIRRDLISKIMVGGFVNLTHVTAKKAEIQWTEDDLFSLLCRRIGENSDLIQMLSDEGRPTDPSGLFASVLPERVEPNRKQSTWQWMLSKTRDGKGNIQPRNLIDLVAFAQEEQLRREKFAPCHKVFPLIRAEAVLNAFDRLSRQRVEDTIVAEVDERIAKCVHSLRDSKAEHNDETLAELFDLPVRESREVAEVLSEIGFFEDKAGIYRIPILYRKGLNIKMGKAFKKRAKKLTG